MRTRDHAKALYQMPRGVDRLSLMCWAEWRRLRLSVAGLAQAAGYCEETLRKLLRGEPMYHRALVAADVWEAIKKKKAPQPESRGE